MLEAAIFETAKHSSFSNLFDDYHNFSLMIVLANFDGKPFCLQNLLPFAYIHDNLYINVYIFLQHSRNSVSPFKTVTRISIFC